MDKEPESDTTNSQILDEEPGENTLQGLAAMPQAGTYYTDNDGELCVYLSHERDHDRIWFARGTQQLGMGREAFLKAMTPAPDGATRRAAEMSALMQEIANDTMESAKLSMELAALPATGAALIGAGGGETSGGESGTGLTEISGGMAQIAQMKKTIAGVRNSMQKFQLQVQKKQDALSALVAEQAAVLQGRMKGLEEMVKAAHETIWTINLYLGKDERIELIADGKPAAAEEPIALLQKVRFMDEESVLEFDRGGIDARGIDKFTAWIGKSAANRDSVLPRQKCVVAIKASNQRREYGDSWTQVQMDEANKHTWFLMRNGEKIFFLDTDLEVGETLFPREDEFASMFERSVKTYDRTTGADIRSTESVRPGSKEYMSAMDRAKGLEKHYLRVFLFLQGVLDRTAVFKPYVGPRLNVFDMMRQDEHLLFVRDAEEARLLGEGRKAFETWLDEINSQISVGHRVIGVFSRSPTGHGEDRDIRTYPKWADLPADLTLHTIEKTQKVRRWGSEHTGYIFYYDRKEDVAKKDRWGGISYGKSERRASYRIEASDTNFVCFDKATVEDMEYYLKSRSNRSRYASMYPVLTRAIKIKQQEAQREAPFKTALAGAIMRDEGLDEAEATAMAEVLVTWWKFKNRTHRALTSDDTLASRMILTEAKLRVRRGKERAEAGVDLEREPLDLLKEAVPQALLIAHMKEREYAVLIAHNDENIFVREQLWRAAANGETVRMLREKTWKTVERGRSGRWTPLFTAERFKDWKFDVSGKEYLTDDERATAMEQGWKAVADGIKADKGQELKAKSGRKGKKANEVVKLAAYSGDKQQVTVVALAQAGITNPLKPRSGETHRPVIFRATVQWSRGAQGIEWKPGTATAIHFWGHHGRGEVDEQVRFLDDLEHGRASDRYAGGKNIFLDKEAIRQVQDSLQEVMKAEKEHGRLYSAEVSPLVNQVREEMTGRRARMELEKFLAEDGDQDLFEAHLKTLDLPEPPWPGEISGYIEALLDEGVEVAGLILEEVVKMGEKVTGEQLETRPTRRKRKGKAKAGRDESEEEDLYPLPMDFVFMTAVAEEDYEYDDDDE